MHLNSQQFHHKSVYIKIWFNNKNAKKTEKLFLSNDKIFCNFKIISH